MHTFNTYILTYIQMDAYLVAEVVVSICWGDLLHINLGQFRHLAAAVATQTHRLQRRAAYIHTYILTVTVRINKSRVTDTIKVFGCIHTHIYSKDT